MVGIGLLSSENNSYHIESLCSLLNSNTEWVPYLHVAWVPSVGALTRCDAEGCAHVAYIRMCSCTRPEKRLICHGRPYTLYHTGWINIYYLKLIKCLGCLKLFRSSDMLYFSNRYIQFTIIESTTKRAGYWGEKLLVEEMQQRHEVAIRCR